MKDPKGVDNKTARQLFICGQIMGIMVRKERNEHVEEGAMEAMLDQVDIELLQTYLDSKPAEFKYSEQCKQVIKMAADRWRERFK